MPGPTIAELEAKVDEVQTALDAEQQQVKDLLAQKDNTITTLNGVITDLQAQVVDGGTAEQRQALLDKLTTLKADLETTADTGTEESEEDNGGGGDNA